MPFVILAIGAVFLVAGIRGTESDYTVNGVQYSGLFTLIKGDFSGQANFLYWFAAIFIIGSAGYVPKFKKVSDAFIVLIIVSMFVAKSTNGTTGGFFTKFLSALTTPATAAPTATVNTASAVTGSAVGDTVNTYSNTVTATPGQSASQAWANTLQNFQSALSSGASYEAY